MTITKKIEWLLPMKPGSGTRTPTECVLAIKPANSHSKRKDRARVVIYKRLMKHARLIEGDRLILGRSEDYYVIARQTSGYLLGNNGGNRGTKTACSFTVTGLKIEAPEFYTMQDIDIDDDGSVLILRNKQNIVVNE